MPEWITQRQAARILDVHVSAVPKMIRRGDLTPRDRRPSLDHAQVIALRDARAARERQRAEPSVKQAPVPPDSVHEWLDASEAAARMGVGPEAVRIRARRGRLPSVVHDGRRWFRADHLELVRHRDEAKRTRAP